MPNEDQGDDISILLLCAEADVTAAAGLDATAEAARALKVKSLSLVGDAAGEK